jgi:hypothetical protein
VVFAHSNLGSGYPDKPVKRGAAVALYPAMEAGWGLRFDLMLGASIRDDDVRAAADVGRMTLSSGAMVWIMATEVRVSTEFEASMAEIRNRAVADGGGSVTARGWGWAPMRRTGCRSFSTCPTLPAAQGAPPPDGIESGPPSRA